MLQWAVSVLVQACYLLHTKPILASMLINFQSEEYIPVKFYSKYQHFQSRKRSVQNGSHSIQVCWQMFAFTTGLQYVCINALAQDCINSIATAFLSWANDVMLVRKSPSEWVSEWLNLAAFLGTADSEVHVVHKSRVIIAYTLESLSSLKRKSPSKVLITLSILLLILTKQKCKHKCSSLNFLVYIL